MAKNRYSLYVLLLIAVAEFAALFLYYPKWKNEKTEAVISYDVSGYYWYLPALFIYKDIKHCSFCDTIIKTYGPTPELQQAYRHSTGNYVMKYAAGQAILLAPAFFAAHAYAAVSGRFPADGFSLPYQLAIAVWALLISLLGLTVLRLVLLHYFSDAVAALTLGSIALATNYVEYAVFSGAMTHNSLFTLYSLLLFLTIRFYYRPSYGLAMLIGLTCGLATITRPTELLSILLPLSWGISSQRALSHRLNFIRSHPGLMLLMAMAAIAVMLIQVYYWHYVTGHYLVYSYGNEGFDWLRPHLAKGLCDPKAGWLLYSPVMMFSIIGFYHLYHNYRHLFWSCLIFFLAFAYVAFSWAEWWYGWSVGHRAMVQSYAVLSLPMAAWYERALACRRLRWLLAPVLAFFLLYNVWLIHGAHRGGLLHGPHMNATYLAAIFGRLHVPEEVFLLMDHTERLGKEQSRYHAAVIYDNDFSADTSANACCADSLCSRKRIRLNRSLQHSPVYWLEVHPHQGQWYCFAADLTATQKEWDVWKMTKFRAEFYQDSVRIKQATVRVHRVLDAFESKRISFCARAPEKPFNKLAIYFDHSGSDKELFIDRLTVEVLKKR